MFAHDFQSAEAYVEEIVQTLVARVDALNRAISESNEPIERPLDIPSAIRRPGPPVARLKEAMAYTRALADAPEHCVAWGLFPLRILDAAAHARFVQELMQHDWPMPWFHHLRIFVREDAGAPWVSTHLKAAPRTDFYALDFSPEKMERSLEDQAADAEEPLETRMQAYLMLAALDYGHQRYQRSIEKYTLLATYFTKTHNSPLLALCLNGIGEVFLRNRDFVSARKYFVSALTPAIAAKGSGIAVLINVGLNLGKLHLEKHEFAQAIEYYEGVSTLADATCNAGLKLQVKEAQGSCYLALLQHREAWEQWQQGLFLARSLGDDVYQERLLQRLISLYDALGMTDQLYRAREELRILQTQGPEALRPLVPAAGAHA
jgi:tetratricopeptide (TPR) repeat protein